MTGPTSTNASSDFVQGIEVWSQCDNSLVQWPQGLRVT